MLPLIPVPLEIGMLWVGIFIGIFILAAYREAYGGEDYDVEMYCLEANEDEDKPRVATEETQPLYWRHADGEQQEGDPDIAGYGCPHCGKVHEFQWGHPTPTPIGTTVVQLRLNRPLVES